MNVKEAIGQGVPCFSYRDGPYTMTRTMGQWSGYHDKRGPLLDMARDDGAWDDVAAGEDGHLEVTVHSASPVTVGMAFEVAVARLQEAKATFRRAEQALRDAYATLGVVLV